jgi:hypothetical protein
MDETNTDPGSAATKPLIGAAELPDTEDHLERLAAVLDEPHPLPSSFSPIAHAFGHRGRSLWRGIRHASVGPSGAAANALVRCLFEAWVLLRWLEKMPAVHVPLWQADHERHALRLLREPEAAVGERLARKFEEWAPAEVVASKKELIAEARANGLAAGIEGVSKRVDGPLLPSMPKMVEAIGAPAITEGYAVVYPLSSAFIHSSASAVLGTIDFHEASKTFGVDDGPLADQIPIRALAATIFAGLLTDVSRIADLGVHDDADVIRRGLVARVPIDFDLSAIVAPADGQEGDEDKWPLD